MPSGRANEAANIQSAARRRRRRACCWCRPGHSGVVVGSRFRPVRVPGGEPWPLLPVTGLMSGPSGGRYPVPAGSAGPNIIALLREDARREGHFGSGRRPCGSVRKLQLSGLLNQLRSEGDLDGLRAAHQVPLVGSGILTWVPGADMTWACATPPPTRGACGVAPIATVRIAVAVAAKAALKAKRKLRMNSLLAL